MRVHDFSSDHILIFSSETLLLRREIWAGENEEVCVHRLGKSAPLTFSSDFKNNIHTFSESAVWGVGDQSTRTYLLDGQRSVYEYLFDEEAQKSIDFIDLGRSWGKSMHDLHETSSKIPDKFLPPRSLQRAYPWLHREKWQQLNNTLSSSQLMKIRQWEEQMVDSDSLQLVHGSPGFLNWLTAKDGTRGVLLTGEDIGYARKDYDLGWVLGELAELHAFYPALRPHLINLQNGLFIGYGHVADEGFNTAIAFRLLQHAFDWHHYAGASQKQAQALIDLAKKYLIR